MLNPEFCSKEVIASLAADGAQEFVMDCERSAYWQGLMKMKYLVLDILANGDDPAGIASINPTGLANEFDKKNRELSPLDPRIDVDNGYIG